MSTMLTEHLRLRLESICAAVPVRTAVRMPDAAAKQYRLDDLLDGRVHVAPAGPHWRLQQGPRELVSLSGCDIGEPHPDQHPELAALARGWPRGVLLVDLETCGFAGSPVFLIGLVYFAGGALRLDQLLARDYREERAILQTYAEVAARHEVLATFNGKSFDGPMLRDRTACHRLAALPELTHCDLLHHARRRYKHVLPNCRLQTLERHLCGRVRRGDIPGGEIPAAYHHFVRSGDARAIRSILYHNALDLVTLAQLAAGMLAEQ